MIASRSVPTLIALTMIAAVLLFCYALTDLVRGRIVGHPDGFGFLVPEEGGVDLFLSAKEMDKVLHGDKAIARVIGVDRKGRPEGKIVEVTERANKHVVGRVVAEHRRVRVVGEDAG